MNLTALFDAQFFAQDWRCRPRVWRGAFAPSLCDGNGMQEVLAHQLISRQDLVVIRNGKPVMGWEPVRRRHWERKRAFPQLDFDPRGLARLLAEGSSLKVYSFCKYHPGVRRLTDVFGEAFNAHVDANAYFTPPRDVCLIAHYDHYDILVLQTEGEKEWDLGDVPAEFDDRMYDNLHLAFPFTPQWREKIRLTAGDILYLPAGTAHQAVAGDAASLHFTFSLHQLKLIDVLENLFESDRTLGKLAHQVLREESSLDANTIDGFLMELRRALVPESARRAFREAANQFRRLPPPVPLPLGKYLLPYLFRYTCHMEEGKTVVRAMGKTVVCDLPVDAVTALFADGLLNVQQVMDRYPDHVAGLVCLVQQLRAQGIITF